MRASVTASGAFIEWLGELQAVETAGGKAASLDRLARAGFRIPPGFCVTTSAFRTHLAGIEAAPAFKSALGALPDESARATVAAAVESAPLPASVEEALGGALTDLAAERPTIGSFAVRSSAIGEDG